jgi:hypothetical protein
MLRIVRNMLATESPKIVAYREMPLHDGCPKIR